MNLSQNTNVPENPLMDTAWTILEAANDLRDRATLEVCRRVIDASYRGEPPAQSDFECHVRILRLRDLAFVQQPSESRRVGQSTPQ
jgi:hypothetical protein